MVRVNGEPLKKEPLNLETTPWLTGPWNHLRGDQFQHLVGVNWSESETSLGRSRFYSIYLMHGVLFCQVRQGSRHISWPNNPQVHITHVLAVHPLAHMQEKGLSFTSGQQDRKE